MSALHRLMMDVASPVSRRLRELATPRTARPRRLDPVVRLAKPGLRAPVTPFERLAVAILEPRVDLPFGTLVARVAEHLYYEALSKDGGVADLGLLGPWLFYAEVAREVLAGDGLLWNLDHRDPAGAAEPALHH